jgi:hypothetical protein
MGNLREIRIRTTQNVWRLFAGIEDIAKLVQTVSEAMKF